MQNTQVLEIPNSIGDKTAAALRFASLLPEQRVEASAETLSFRRPVFANVAGTRVEMVDWREMRLTCKWLRAFTANKFVFGSENYNLTYQPELDAAQLAKVHEFMAFTGIEEEGPSRFPATLHIKHQIIRTRCI